MIKLTDFLVSCRVPLDLSSCVRRHLTLPQMKSVKFLLRKRKKY